MRIWLDYEQLRGSDAIIPGILDALNNSALLIPILSKACFASPWCRQEFTTFTAHHPDWRERLFPVWMALIEPDDLDEEARAIRDRLRELLGYQSWYRDQANRIRARWFPFVDPSDRDYSDTQQNMACHMAERLGRLAGDKPSPEPATPPPSQPSVPCDPPIPPFQGHHLVMINGGSSDAPLVREIARTLAACEGLGYVVPLMAQDRRTDYKPSELLRDLRENLNLATAALMVVHKGPPDQINEQLREYTKAVAKYRKRIPSLICHLSNQPLSCPPGTRVQVCQGVAGMSRPSDPVAEIRRPYPGLRLFRRDEADRFFGREEQIDQLLDKLAETHFLAVLGTSGSGKSSLVRAGSPVCPGLAGQTPTWRRLGRTLRRRFRSGDAVPGCQPRSA